MKKIFFVAIALAFALSAQAQKANIQFDKTTIDLGKFGGDDLIKKCHFIFKNTGDAKLYIHQNIDELHLQYYKYRADK